MNDSREWESRAIEDEPRRLRKRDDNKKHALHLRNRIVLFLLIMYTGSLWRLPRTNPSMMVPLFACSTTVKRYPKFVFVSCYFPMKSNAPISSYSVWVPQFLRMMIGQLYFFTNDRGLAILSHVIRNMTNVHIITKYRTVWDIPCMQGRSESYIALKTIDPEFRPWTGRYANLYAVWNSKTCLLREVSNILPHSIVFWIDSGSAREPQFKDMKFPDAQRLHELYPDGTTKGKMVFTMNKKTIIRKEQPVRMMTGDGITGAFYGGDHQAIEDFFQGFWHYHDLFLAKGVFVGNDYQLIATYLVYSDWTWIQPNFAAVNGCSPSHAVFSFLSDPSICFRERINLTKSTEMIK